MSEKNEEEIVDSLMSLHLEGYEAVEKVVKQSGNSGRVYLPISWVGSVVKIVRLTPIKQTKETNSSAEKKSK